MLLSPESLAKINLDVVFLEALPRELIIETIVNQLSIYSGNDLEAMGITKKDIPPIVLSQLPFITFTERNTAENNTAPTDEFNI